MLTLDPALVRGLVERQFPQWAHLPVTPVPVQGWDNRTFRLGDELSVRLPSAAGYEPQVLKEHQWLPHLAPYLPLPIPEPVALGRPTDEYPFVWSVYRWLDGQVLSLSASAIDLSRLAMDLGGFLTSLRRVPAAGGPPPGEQTAQRGGPLSTYAKEARDGFRALSTGDAQRAEAVLAEALCTDWDGAPVWFHGDVAVDNLLVKDGRLAAVLDFGCSGVGDPACDLVIAWTLLRGPSRARFRHALGLDPATWARGRGWALWKAVITVADEAASPAKRLIARRALGAVLGSTVTGRPHAGRSRPWSSRARSPRAEG